MTYEEDQKLILNTEKSISYNEGMEDRNIEIAKNLISLNIDINDIVKATGLSKREVESLK